MNLKSLILAILLIGTLISSSCSEDDTLSPDVIGNEITGVFSGTFSHRKPYENSPEITENKQLIISRHNNQPTVLNVSIENFSWVVVFTNITHNGGSKYSGTTYVYNSITDIGKEGYDVAGSGSFFYENDLLHILWTADPINDEWTFSFSGERK